MGQIYLIRHAQAWFGTDDYDRLSELGFRQARLLGRWFGSCDASMDRVVAGAMRRHLESASSCLDAVSATSAPYACDVQVDELLNEFDHDGVLDAFRESDHEAARHLDSHIGDDPVTSSAMLQRYFALAMERWMSGQHDGDYGESWHQFRERSIEGFERIATGASPAKRIAVFTSGGVIAAICQHLLDLSNKATRDLNWSLANTGVTRVLSTKGRRGLDYLNSTAHFEWACSPQMLTYR
ncbi:histidine phosphatase family protein [Paraburkholderia sp. BR13439]|uniref:histidine phosphatase family protein n=1 Tax=Paraburkholderia TaxID=1822464 RepID=UPI0034CD8B6F